MRILPIAFYGKKLNGQELVQLTEEGGLQYELPKPILQLIKEGYIVPK